MWGVRNNPACDDNIAALVDDWSNHIDATFCHDRRHPDGTMLSADELSRATATSLHNEFADVTTTEEILAGRARPID